MGADYDYGRDLFRSLNLSIERYPRPIPDEDCALCGDGTTRVCSTCVQTQLRLTGDQKRDVYAALIEHKETERAKRYARVFAVSKSKGKSEVLRMRRRMKLTQQEFGTRFGISQSLLSKLETGARMPSDKIRKRLNMT